MKHRLIVALLALAPLLLPVPGFASNEVQVAFSQTITKGPWTWTRTINGASLTMNGSGYYGVVTNIGTNAVQISFSGISTAGFGFVRNVSTNTLIGSVKLSRDGTNAVIHLKPGEFHSVRFWTNFVWLSSTTNEHAFELAVPAD